MAGIRDTKPSADVYDANGVKIGTVTTEDQGDTLTVTIGDVVRTFFWEPNLILGGGTYYDNGNPENASAHIILECEQWSPDGCTRYSYTSYNRTPPGPWGKQSSPYGEGKIY